MDHIMLIGLGVIAIFTIAVWYGLSGSKKNINSSS